MKSKTFAWIIAVTSLVALAMPLRFAAQNQKKTHHHYQLIDVGTFGGPSSYLSAFSANVLNKGGTFASWADTPIKNSFLYILLQLRLLRFALCSGTTVLLLIWSLSLRVGAVRPVGSTMRARSLAFHRMALSIPQLAFRNNAPCSGVMVR